jgi:hypothetical protein
LFTSFFYREGILSIHCATVWHVNHARPGQRQASPDDFSQRKIIILFFLLTGKLADDPNFEINRINQLDAIHKR